MDSHLDGVSSQVTAGVEPHDTKVGRGLGGSEVSGEQLGEVCVGLDELGGVVEAATAVQSRLWVVALSIPFIDGIVCKRIFSQVIFLLRYLSQPA